MGVRETEREKERERSSIYWLTLPISVVTKDWVKAEARSQEFHPGFSQGLQKRKHLGHHPPLSQVQYWLDVFGSI